MNFESTPDFRPLASISVLNGKEEGSGWWAWEHYPGREEVGGLEGAVGDWPPDLVNRSAEKTPLIQGRNNHDSHRRDRIRRDFLHWIFRYFLQILGGSSY